MFSRYFPTWTFFRPGAVYERGETAKPINVRLHYYVYSSSGYCIANYGLDFLHRKVMDMPTFWSNNFKDEGEESAEL